MNQFSFDRLLSTYRNECREHRKAVKRVVQRFQHADVPCNGERLFSSAPVPYKERMFAGRAVVLCGIRRSLKLHSQAKADKLGDALDAVVNAADGVAAGVYASEAEAEAAYGLPTGLLAAWRAGSD